MSNNENESPKVGQIYVRDVWSVRGYFSEFYAIVRLATKTAYYQRCDIEGSPRHRAQIEKCLIANLRFSIGALLTTEQKHIIKQKQAQSAAQSDMLDFCREISKLVRNADNNKLIVSPEQIALIKNIYENFVQQDEVQ